MEKTTIIRMSNAITSDFDSLIVYVSVLKLHVLKHVTHVFANHGYIKTKTKLCVFLYLKFAAFEFGLNYFKYYLINNKNVHEI